MLKYEDNIVVVFLMTDETVVQTVQCSLSVINRKYGINMYKNSFLHSIGSFYTHVLHNFTHYEVINYTKVNKILNIKPSGI